MPEHRLGICPENGLAYATGQYSAAVRFGSARTYGRTNEELTHLDMSSYVSIARRGAERFDQLGDETERSTIRCSHPKLHQEAQ
jgi:hypothetical protein